jgi:hypothetical protein
MITGEAVSAQVRRHPLLLLALLGGGLVVAYQSAQAILGNDMVTLAFIGMGFICCAIVVSILNDWRRGLYMMLCWLLVEDLFRKYLGNNMAIFFAKDFLVAIVYLSFFLAWRRKEVEILRPPFYIPLVIFVWFCFCQVFNPSSTSILFGALGMKLFFYYAPLMLVGYALVDTEVALRKFFTVNMVMICLIGSLGIIQAIAGHTFLNPAVQQEDIRELSTLYRVAPISGAIVYRPTSVFVSTGRFGDFLLAAWPLTLGYVGYLLLRHKGGRIFASITLSVTFGAAVLSASRGLFLSTLGSTIACSIVFLWGAPKHEGGTMRILRAIQRSLFAITLAVVLLLATYPDALLGRLAVYAETLSPYSPASELSHRTNEYPMRNFIAAFSYPQWPYGYGIGGTALGTQYIARYFHVKPGISGVESGYGELVVELGIVGLLLWLLWTGAAVGACLKVVRRLKGSPYLPIAFVICWYAAALLFPYTYAGIQAYEDYILNAYLWLLFGVLFRLPHLKLSAEYAAAANTTAAPRRRWIV